MVHYLKKVSVESVVLLGALALDIVPPIARKHLLTENGSIRTKK